MKCHVYLLVVFAGVLVAGCASNKEEVQPFELKKINDLTRTQFKEIDLNKASEVDLVEKLQQVRADYQRLLELLRQWYLDNGYFEKARWARRELDDLKHIRTYPYLVVIEAMASPANAASKQVVEADQLYEQAEKLRKEGAPMPLVNDMTKLKDALALYKRIVYEYPQSTKSPDAAFYAGEISKEYLNDNSQAIEYYRLALRLNPNIDKPVRFQMAVIYDYRQHDRANALKMYQKVLTEESEINKSNARWASERIKQLLHETEEGPTPAQ